jgi:predicted  nucleic acid-binding Zn-ribbon protein
MAQELKVIPAEEITRRFDRIEDKLDQLSEAMVTLARNEEKIIAIQEQVSQHSSRLNRHSEKIDNIELIANSNAFTSKIVWAVLVAVIGAVVSMIFGVM